MQLFFKQKWKFCPGGRKRYLAPSDETDGSSCRRTYHNEVSVGHSDAPGHAHVTIFIPNGRRSGMLSNSITKMAKSLTDLMKLRREVQGTREGFDVSALTLYLECICRNNGCSVTVSLGVK